MNEISCDVVVVGAGIAGLVAAVRAAQLGKRVAVLEKGVEQQYLCNTRYSGGSFHVCFNYIMSGEQNLLRAIEAATAGYARPGLVRAVAQDGPQVVRWLQNEGVRFLKANVEGEMSRGEVSYVSWILAPPKIVRPGLNWKGRGGDVMLKTLEDNLSSRGGRIYRGMRARALTMDKRRCIGVKADSVEGPAHFRTEATVIADGGFQGAPDLLRAHITPRPEQILQRGAGTGIGDGLRMAQAVGAATIGLDSFYGHPLSIDAFTNDLLWPVPLLDALTMAGIVVDRHGRRFVDEGHSGIYTANAIARLDEPLSASVVFDQAVWEGPGRSALIPPNPHLKDAGGTLYMANSIHELATQMHVSAETLQETITTYNAALDAGGAATLTPPRHSDSHNPFPIAIPPFYAAPLCAGITNTMGGIETDEFGRVVDEGGAVIPGLYAAGTTTGGLEGGPAVGYVGGLVKSSVMAFRAADKIAEEFPA